MPLHGLDNVKKMIAKNKKDTNDDLFKIYVKGLTGMIKPTPVDKGRARNNWFLTMGSPFGLSAGRDANKSGSGSSASVLTMDRWILNKKVYFTNNLPYIETLEYGGYPSQGGEKTTGGYSNQLLPLQSPGGWVRAELIRMQNKIRPL